MQPDPSRLIRHASAWLPIALSLLASAILLAHVAVYGIVHEPDEGTAAHLFQLLMALQLPVVALFLVRWAPRQPRAALRVFAAQLFFWCMAWALVYWLT